MSKNNNYPVDLNTDVPPVLRRTDANIRAPEPLNEEDYGGPQNNGHRMPKPVVPTTTYFITVLMKNIDPPPPPGATEQYVTER